MLARAGFDRLTPRATLLLAVACNIPDCDVVTALRGPVGYLQHHREYTHTLLLSPVMALVAIAVTLLLGRIGFGPRWMPIFSKDRRPLRWIPAFFLAWLGVLSHLLFDWTNMYGIRMLLPLSGEWLRLDTVNVIDLWIWAIFFFALVAPWLSKLVSSEIGAKSGRGQGMAIVALCALCAYEYGRFLAHDRALQILNARLYQGVAASRFAAFPNGYNPLAWRGLVETKEFVSFHEINLLLPDFDPNGGEIYYRADPHPAFAPAMQTEAFQVFRNFSQFPFWRVRTVPGESGKYRVEGIDLRFGTPAQPAFVASAVVDAQGRVEQSDFRFGVSPIPVR